MNQNESIAPTVSSTISNMTRDMNFVGIITIIGGALSCLTIIGAIIGIPVIISGMRLREAATAFTSYQSSNDAGTLMNGFERQGRYFFIQKVLTIIGLVIAALYLIIILGVFVCAGARY